MVETTADDTWFQEVTEEHNRNMELAQQRLTSAAQGWIRAEAEYVKRGGQPEDFRLSDHASDLSAGTYEDSKDLLLGDFLRTPDRNILKIRVDLVAINGFRISSGPYDHTEIIPGVQSIDPGREFELASVYLTKGYSSPRILHEFYVSSYGPTFSLANLALNEASDGSILIAPSMTDSSTNES